MFTNTDSDRFTCICITVGLYLTYIAVRKLCFNESVLRDFCMQLVIALNVGLYFVFII